MNLNDEEVELLDRYRQLPPDIRPLAQAALTHLNNRAPNTGAFGALIGYRHTVRSPGKVDCELEITSAHFNPIGIAHGGVIYTMVDAAMGSAVLSLLPPDKLCVSAEIKLNYLKPVHPGHVVAHATVAQCGQRLAVVTAEVTNEAGEIVGVALGTFAILDRKPRQPHGSDT